VLTACEIARYTPLSKVNMQNDYEKAAQVILVLDRQLNKNNEIFSYFLGGLFGWFFSSKRVV